MYQLNQITHMGDAELLARSAYANDLTLALHGVNDRAGQRIAKREQEKSQRRGALSRIMGKR